MSRARVFSAILACVFCHAAQSAAAARNVVLFIGDGFGPGQMALGLQYAKMVEARELHFERLMKAGNTGYSLPLPYGSPVTDSAAAATQMATGVVARNETLGLSADGYPLETIVEWAEDQGMATGLVTNMRLMHGTPAGFAAHQVSRYNPEDQVLDQIVMEHEIDVLMGGGGRAFVPQGSSARDFLPGIPAELDDRSSRSDDRNRIADLKARGYDVVSSRSELLAVAPEARRVLGVFAASNFPYVLDRGALGLESLPSLAEMTKSALEVLSRAPGGFFLMVEGGLIDYAGHDNDAGSMLHEVLDFDEAIGVGAEFQRRHPETLVIVTADHATGGFSFTYGGEEGALRETLMSGLEYRPDHAFPAREHLMALYGQRASFDFLLEEAGGSPERLVDAFREWTAYRLTIDEAREALTRDVDGKAWTRDFRHFYNDPDDNRSCLLGRAVSRQTFVTWSTGGHTTEPVLTFGVGPGAEALRGVYVNTHVWRVVVDGLGGRARND